MLSAVGGWIQFSPYWHPLTTWLEPAARTLGVAVLDPGRQEVTSGLALALGLGIAVAYAIYGSGRLAVPRLPAVQRALEHKLYFDEAYDAVFFKPAAALAVWLHGEIEEQVILPAALTSRRARLPRAALVRRLQTGVLRTYVFFLGIGMAILACLPGGAMTVSSFTTLLVCLPMGAALAIWILPLSRYTTGALAVLVSLLEVGIWIEQAARFDFSAHGLQFSQRASWISDLHVSYHVGEYGFSLWLVGLTVVCMAAAIGYGFWVGRDRPRAYFGLMLFLTGATVGVFVAQDLLLFYAFFEAMLIPLYVLVGVWGGPGGSARP